MTLTFEALSPPAGASGGTERGPANHGWLAATFPLSQLQDAYRQLASGHIRGKIVLMV